MVVRAWSRTTAILWNLAALAHFQFEFSVIRAESTRFGIYKTRRMHSTDTPSGHGVSLDPNEYKPCLTFTPAQLTTCVQEPRIGPLVAEKTARGEFFYGLEVIAADKHKEYKPICIDFNGFLPVLPTLVSVVWLTPYWDVPLQKVISLHLVRALESRIPVMPHLSLYRQSKERLDEFFSLKMTNLLAVAGDVVDETQPYYFCYQLVEHAKRIRGDDISISVAGYPEGYTAEGSGPQDKVRNMEYLIKKIDAGADCIFTQMSYSADKIVEFIRDARDAGITLPIVVGIMVHDSLASYLRSEIVTNVHLPPAERAELECYGNDNAKAKKFFIQLTLCIIKQVLDANLGVWGVQFYTLNRFALIQEVLAELRSQGILKEPTKEVLR